jgi:hypothetical protein
MRRLGAAQMNLRVPDAWADWSRAHGGPDKHQLGGRPSGFFAGGALD